MDAYTEVFQPTSAQQELAQRVVASVVQWNQEETQAERTARLEEVLSQEVAGQAAGWDDLYGGVDGASVTVESTGEPTVSSNDGTTIAIGVMVDYTVHIPHDDGTEVASPGTRLWVVEIAVTEGQAQATGVQWPDL
ncbi:hypothetical protein [Actinomyces ruminis]|uniref:Uncharacterized protein n=1 Tax=Actinomyces ruminis TaxID=1937003 RepID=A0ABX4MEF1_9ACTO|nr:hypothetical protein [Actinomyces ruminis]PHP52462.1 hypothetical protein BW737_009290 [Actinomyces ruminis]